MWSKWTHKKDLTNSMSFVKLCVSRRAQGFQEDMLLYLLVN